MSSTKAEAEATASSILTLAHDRDVVALLDDFAAVIVAHQASLPIQLVAITEAIGVAVVLLEKQGFTDRPAVLMTIFQMIESAVERAAATQEHGPHGLA